MSQPNFSFGAPEPEPQFANRRQQTSFPARYRSPCNGCGEWIDEGEPIVMTDDGAKHEECQGLTAPSRTTTRDITSALASGVVDVCRRCFLVHPKGSCDRD